MVAVVFVGPVGGVDDVGIRGGGRQRMIFDIELNGRAWGLQPEDLQVSKLEDLLWYLRQSQPT